MLSAEFLLGENHRGLRILMTSLGIKEKAQRHGKIEKVTALLKKGGGGGENMIYLGDRLRKEVLNKRQ